MRSIHLPLRRLSFALVLGLACASLTSIAAESSDVTEIEVASGGNVERVTLDDLKVGESRQLYSEAGTLVTATRTADAIELDIAGEKTRIVMPGDGLSSKALHVISDGDHDGHRIVEIHRKDGSHESHGVDGERRVVVIAGDDADVHTLDGTEDISVMLEALGGDDSGDGKRVVVKRRIVRESGDAAADGK